MPRTAQSVIDFWNSATGGKAVLILDGLSLRESPWLLQEAKRRGYQIQQAGARGIGTSERYHTLRQGARIRAAVVNRKQWRWAWRTIFRAHALKA